MDDLKLYAPSHDKLKELISLVENFSSDISMSFGLDKCKVINTKEGKCVTGEVTLETGGLIESMGDEDLYKYLGYQQAKTIDHKNIKQALEKEYTSRLTKLCKTELNSKNLVKAINTLAIPVLTYSFGVISWTKTDLESLMRKTRVLMTKERKHHPKSCTLRMTLPRAEGGRGLIDIENLHNNQVRSLRKHFHTRKQVSELHSSICQNDRNYTPLNLADEEEQESGNDLTNDQKHDEWMRRSLHGRYPHEVNQPHVDKLASYAWLTSGELMPETEGFFVAIQDQVINTKNYLKHIVRDPQVLDDRCRKCREKPETIQHITSACSMLSQSDYLYRHNQVAAIIHQDICFNRKLVDTKIQYYKYKPPPVLEKDRVVIYYDRSIITDRCVPYNRPDIVIWDKNSREVLIVDVAIPNTHNVISTSAEKKRKYTELADEMKRMWQVQKVTIVPIVISTTGIIPKELHKNIQILGLHKNTFILLQKAVVLNTTRIVRRFLSQN
uniref:Reverse transcriptase domain-containing protein n=1 Tax=Cacopsylla melanoneura TaxID=428564 RepID=A0A8D8RDC3_9HEMI